MMKLLDTLGRTARKRPVLSGLLAAVPIVVAGVLLRSGAEASAARYHTVERGNFLVSIVEGGNLEAVNEVVVRNEVEGSARIVYLIPEGTQVRKGDLLVELDSAEAEEKLNQQEIAYEKAKAAFVQAENDLEIQKSVVQSEIDAAQLRLDFAIIEQQKFKEGARRQQIREAEISIQSTEESLLLAKEELDWSRRLFDQGFETKSVVDKGELGVLKQELELEKARTNLWMLVSFDIPKQEKQFVSDVEEARKELERVRKQGESRLTQYETDLTTEKNTLELNLQKLENDREQLTNTRIHAPQDGFVVYAISSSRFSSETLVEEGATVRNRQNLIKLPDTSRMKVEVKIHESHIGKVSKGLVAYVVLDSDPDSRYRGIVTRVATLPDTQSRWANPNLKVYSTEVEITDPLPDLKPGVSANVEVVITNIADTIKVPIQSVTSVGGRQVCFLPGDPPRPVPVEVGLFNSRQIQITAGLEEGDLILLSPPLDSEVLDLEGEILEESQVTAADLEPDPGARKRLESGAEPEPPGRNAREEFIKRFDADGDGELSESEMKAAREAAGNASGGGGRPRGGGAGRPGTQ